MKKLIDEYSFDASARQITLTGYMSVNLEDLLVITNVTDNIIIYSFASQGKGASVSGNIITLDYDTTGMSDSDVLQVFIDDGESPASNSVLELLDLLVKQLLKRSESLAVVDTAQRQRIAVEVMPSVAISTMPAIGGTVAVSSIPANSTVKPVDSANNVTHELFSAATYSRYVAVPDVWRTTDIARQTYQQGIRSNLSFTS
jgi:hypothetical protein